jgi:hypothetical protein
MSALMSTAAQGTPLFRVSINHLVYAQAHEVFNSCFNDLPLPLEALPGLNSALRRQAAMACIRRAPSGLSTPQQIFKEAVTHNLPKTIEVITFLPYRLKQRIIGRPRQPKTDT